MALTFDDFCTVGALAAAHPDLIRAQSAEGHASCDHTVHHDNHLDRRRHR